MDWWDYLHPDNPLPARIIAALAYGFVVWMILLLVKVIHLVYTSWQMSRLSAVGPLRDELGRRAQARRREPEDEPLSLPPVAGEAVSREPEGDDDTRAKVAFTDFCRDAGASATSVVAGHVRSIFLAGWKSSQLQTDALARNTANRLFRFNGVLRSLLSLFIIVGLLGTLFGLAASLAQLSPLMSETAQQQQQVNVMVGQGLRDLLRELKGAFAPSIWGVIYTIAGVLIFAVYSYFCQYVKDRLEGLTQDVWLTDLYPSPFQQQLMSLVQTEELIRKNRRSVELVASFAGNIKSDIVRLNESMVGASRTLESLDDSSTRISDFAEKFREGVTALVPFQEELRALYTQMQADSKIFHQGVRVSVQESAAFQRKAGEMLARQGGQIDDLLKALNSYEQAYIKVRGEIDAKLVEVLDKAKLAYEQLAERNTEVDRAIRESLADPLRKDLGERLGALQTTLETKLSAVVSRFGTFDAPIKESAETIRTIAGTIDKRALDLTARLRHEYLQQGAANQQQLGSLVDLSRQLSTLLVQFEGASRTQGDSTAALRDATVALGRRLEALAAKLDTLAAQKASADGGGDFGRIEKLASVYTAAIIKELRELGRNSGVATGGNTAPRGGGAGQGQRGPLVQHTLRPESAPRPGGREPFGQRGRGPLPKVEPETRGGAGSQPDKAHGDDTRRAAGATAEVDPSAGVPAGEVGEIGVGASDETGGSLEAALREAGEEPETWGREQGPTVWTGGDEDVGADSRGRIRRAYDRVAGALRNRFGRG